MTSRAILHVDMDAFFASVEQADDPRLRGKPVLVGGASRRGVVAAASYEARRYGARSAMPMMEALRRCPHAIVVEPRRERYEEVSARVFEIFERYTPLVEGLSLDEAFLDVTASRSLFGDAPTIARRIKGDVLRDTGLTCSAGVAIGKFAAKIASDLQKPDGLVVVPEDVAGFLAPLPVERMWGVGPKTSVRVRAAGLLTLGHLARADMRTMSRLFGGSARQVQSLARGDDAREVEAEGVPKRLGAEETYEEDLVTRDAVERCLLDQATRVANRLVAAGLGARGVTVKLKLADFTVRARQTTLEARVCDATSLYRAARSLLDRFDRGLYAIGIRLTGLHVHDLGTLDDAPSLFPDEERAKRTALERTLHDVSTKYAGAIIGAADVVAKRSGQTGELGVRGVSGRRQSTSSAVEARRRKDSS